MKFLSSLALGSVCCFSAAAQKCEGYLLMQAGKTVTMTHYNRKGEPNGKVVYKITGAENNQGALTSTVSSEVFDSKGGILSSGTSNVQCTGNAYRADVHLVMSQQQVKQLRNFNATGDFYVDYPVNMKVGDVLKDAQYTLQSTNSEGIVTEMNVAIEERTVLAEEQVTTAAGTWNCFKIKAHITFKAQVGGLSIPLSVDNMEWFAPGVGVVRNEAKSYRSELTSVE
ncbi:hypothetical protein [Rurimicrobium arvi]